MGLFATRVTAEGLVKQTDISAFITEDEAGNLISNAVIQADKINFDWQIQLFQEVSLPFMEEGTLLRKTLRLQELLIRKWIYSGGSKRNEYGL